MSEVRTIDRTTDTEAAGVVRRRRFTMVREMSFEEVDRSCKGVGRSMFVIAGPATPGVAMIRSGIGDNIGVVDGFDGVEERTTDFDRLKLVVTTDPDEETPVSWSAWW